MDNKIPKHIQIESKPCPLGCEGEDELLFKGRDRLHALPGEFSVVRCRICGLMRTNPRPTQETIGFYYPNDYSPYHQTKVKTDVKEAVNHPLWKRIAGKVFQFNTDQLPVLQPGRMLEIGCASGAFLHQMSKKGWDVAGIEFSAQAADNARMLGYPIHVGPLETAPDPDRPYDIIVGWMVIEHLHDPILALQKLHSWTKPDGWLVISIPNAGAYEFRLFQEAWYALQLPTHLYHYTPKTLHDTLKRGGWQIDRILHQRTITNLIASIGYKLKDLNSNLASADVLIDFPEKGANWVYRILLPFAFIAGLLGQSGRMTVWARRKD